MASAVVMIAKAFFVSTYLEEGMRLVNQWEDSSSFVFEHWGHPIGTVLLLATGLPALGALPLLLPTSIHPAMPHVQRMLAALCSVSVLLEPTVWLQTKNAQAIVLSLVQLSVLGLVFSHSYEEELIRLDRRARSMLSAITKLRRWTGHGGLLSWLHWLSCMELVCRIMLTCDLLCTFGGRVLDGVLGALCHEAGSWQSVSSEAASVCSTVSGSVSSTAASMYMLAVIALLLVWLGACTRFAASLAAVTAFADACIRFTFWKGSSNADFQLFHFFQVMTSVGGLLLLSAQGPGQLSLDALLAEKRAPTAKSKTTATATETKPKRKMKSRRKRVSTATSELEADSAVAAELTKPAVEALAEVGRPHLRRWLVERMALVVAAWRCVACTSGWYRVPWSLLRNRRPLVAAMTAAWRCVVCSSSEVAKAKAEAEAEESVTEAVYVATGLAARKCVEEAAVAEVLTKERDDDTCVVCLDALKTHVLVPCGHLCVCASCCDDLMTSSRSCPMCRQGASMSARVYR